MTDHIDYRTITELRSLQILYPLVLGETIHGIDRERTTFFGDIGGWLEGRSRFARRTTTHRVGRRTQPVA